MVQNNHAHIGLIEKPIETKNLHKEIVYEDQLVLAGDAASKFWLLREKNSGLRFFNELYLNEHSINLPIIELNNNEVLLQLLKNNIGQSIVSRLSISDEIPWQPIDQSFPSLKFITESLKKFVNDKPKKQENDLAFAKSFSCFLFISFLYQFKFKRF